MRNEIVTIEMFLADMRKVGDSVTGAFLSILEMNSPFDDYLFLVTDSFAAIQGFRAYLLLTVDLRLLESVRRWSRAESQ